MHQENLVEIWGASKGNGRILEESAAVNICVTDPSIHEIIRMFEGMKNPLLLFEEEDPFMTLFLKYVLSSCRKKSELSRMTPMFVTQS